MSIVTEKEDRQSRRIAPFAALALILSACGGTVARQSAEEEAVVGTKEKAAPAIEGLYMGGPAEVTITGAEEYQGTLQPAEWAPRERIIPGWIIAWPGGTVVRDTLGLRYEAPGIELTINPDEEWGPHVRLTVVLIDPDEERPKHGPDKHGRRYVGSAADCAMSVDRPASDRLEGTVECSNLVGSSGRAIDAHVRFAGGFIESVGSGFTYTTGGTELTFTGDEHPRTEGPGTLHWARVDPPGGVIALYYSDGIDRGVWIHGRSFEGTAITSEDLTVAFETVVFPSFHDVSECTVTLHEVSQEALEGSMDCSGRVEWPPTDVDVEPVDFTVTFTASA